VSKRGKTVKITLGINYVMMGYVVIIVNAKLFTKQLLVSVKSVGLWTAWGGGRRVKKGKTTLISISPTILPEDPNLILPSEKLLLQHPQYLCRPVGENN
jgi:hypothetical protein